MVNLVNFFDWYPTLESDQRPWLVLGKGPSFSDFGQVDTSAYRLCSLNHVIEKTPVTLAHCIDLDVIADCAEAFEKNAQFLVMPWIPHVVGQRFGNQKRKTGDKTLEQWCSEIAVLGSLASQGRLLWYNLFTGYSRNRGTTPVVHTHGFSAGAAIRLLAYAGAASIRSLGVDGGQNYAGDFAPLADKTRLSDGQSNYNSQFTTIAEVISETGCDYANLTEPHPIKIFVGMEPEQDIAFDVLAYSIRKHASASVDIQPLWQAVDQAGIEIPTPQNPVNRPRTPFSFQRFVIPQLCGYRGRAIYLDSDMLVFDDIRKLWLSHFGDADLLYCPSSVADRPPQYSVMLMNCEALDWDIKAIVRGLDENLWSYEQLVYDMLICERQHNGLAPQWNDLEQHSRETRLLHYTDMAVQPWLSSGNPLARLWCECLIEGIESGAISIQKLESAISSGHIRPSLAWQIEHRVSDPLLIPLRILRRDISEFLPPHLQARASAVRKIQFTIQRSAALLRALGTSGTKNAVKQLRSLRRRYG